MGVLSRLCGFAKRCVAPGSVFDLVCSHPFLILPIVVAIPALLLGGVGQEFGVDHLFRATPGTLPAEFRSTAVFFLPATWLIVSVNFLLIVIYGHHRLIRLIDSSSHRTVSTELEGAPAPLPSADLSLPVVIGAYTLVVCGLYAWRDLNELGRATAVYFVFLMTVIAVGLAMAVSVLTSVWSRTAPPETISPVLLQRCLSALAFGLVALIAVYLYLAVGAVGASKISPALGLTFVVALVAAAHVFLHVFPRGRRAIAAAVIAIGALVVGATPRFKYTFDGIVCSNGSDAYGRPLKVLPSDHVAYHKNPCKGDPVRARALLVPPTEALRAWGDDVAREGRRKPKLVVVAASGGGYRAAFWTATVLDHLRATERTEAGLAGFSRSVRLLTGASGGMVALAYLVAIETRRKPDETTASEEIVTTLLADIRSANKQPAGAAAPGRADSLSAIARQFVRADLFNLIAPKSISVDRGKALERQWPSLSVSFGSLREFERQGRIPSLIVSPVMVESGRPLLISNLDLREMLPLKKLMAAEFFRWFPASSATFTLATAVRMNASFPYVSPAVDLPIEPPQRMTDAGFYDNYGIATAASYLSLPDVYAWAKENTSGIALIEIRAFGDAIGEIGGAEGVECRALAASVAQPKFQPFRSLSAPLSALMSTRNKAMIARNDQQVELLQSLYDPVHPSVHSASPRFLESFVFVDPAKAGMSWHLTADELKCIGKQMATIKNEDSLARLLAFWKRD